MSPEPDEKPRRFWEVPTYRFAILYVALLTGIALAYPALRLRFGHQFRALELFTSDLVYWLLSAFGLAFESPADAIILLSDGLPNPAFNDSLTPSRLVRQITISNTGGKEIHAVTIGDYFKYRGTVEFMESLARANAGGFLALSE